MLKRRFGKVSLVLGLLLGTAAAVQAGTMKLILKYKSSAGAYSFVCMDAPDDDSAGKLLYKDEPVPLGPGKVKVDGNAKLTLKLAEKKFKQRFLIIPGTSSESGILYELKVNAGRMTVTRKNKMDPQGIFKSTEAKVDGDTCTIGPIDLAAGK